MRIPALLLAIPMILLASCDDDSTSSADQDSFPSRREIPASLWAKCTDMTAARAAAAPYPQDGGSVMHVSYGIYDSTGALVGQGAQDVSTSGSYGGYGGDPLNYVMWNGRDAAGNKVPPGHYFMFIEMRDEQGTLVDSRSVCIGVAG